MMRLYDAKRPLTRSAASCLALILWTTVTLKLQAGTEHTDMSPLLLYGVVAIEISCALLLTLGKPRWGAYGAAAIVLVGIAVRIVYPAFRCGCLGGTDDPHQIILRTLAIAVCVLASVIVWTAGRPEEREAKLPTEPVS